MNCSMASYTQDDVFRTIEDQLKKNHMITFKWLSRMLKLRSTIAKQYLNKFVDNKWEDAFIITYMVFGRKENGELLLMLTKEKDETQFSEKNYTVVDKQVYSIQPSESKFNSAMIYNIDKSTYEMQQMSLSSINYHTEIIRKTNLTRTVASNELTNHQDSAKQITNGRAKVQEVNSVKKSESVKDLSGSKDAYTGKTSGGKKEKTKTAAANGRIADFFTKGSVKREPAVGKAVEASKEDLKEAEKATFEEKPASKIESPNSKTKTDKELRSTKDEKKTKSPAKKTENTVSRTSKNPGKPSLSIKAKPKSKDKKKKKQFKRIVSPLDSDSESESIESDSPVEEIEPEHEPELEPVNEPEAPRVTVVSGKKRKRKEVVKEVMDDEGYLNTIKEIVYESCDSEEEVDGNPETNKRTRLDQPPPVLAEKNVMIQPPEAKNQKTKQASILNFFKKPQKSDK